jgi:hypothetical protein
MPKIDGWTISLTTLFIKVYSYFLNYPCLHRAYPLNWGQSGPTPRFFIWWPRAPHKVASPRRTLRYDATCYHQFPLEPPPPSFEAQTKQNPLSVAMGGFSRISHQTTVSIAPRACPPCPGHVSHESSTMSAIVLLPCHHTGVSPMCQLPQLVTRWL